jgi:hypothetical protein
LKITAGRLISRFALARQWMHFCSLGALKLSVFSYS